MRRNLGVVLVRSRFLVFLAVVGALLAPSLAPARAVDVSPTAGGLRIEAEIPYPAFPCNFVAHPCVANLVGQMSGAVSGVDNAGNVPWAVEFNASVNAEIFYPTLWLTVYPVPAGWCQYENSRGPATVTSIHASGTYGGVAVTGVSATGELGYVRVGTDAAGIALDHLRLTLALEGGSEVTVSAGRFGAGAGRWQVIEGSVPSDCGQNGGPGAPFDGPAMTARLEGALVAGVQPDFG